MKCSARSSMFAYESRNTANHECFKNAKKCKCRCEPTAEKQGNCDQIENESYDLYKFSNPHLGNVGSLSLKIEL